ncbi:MAG: MBL fold metallo-hydrolase [Bacteroidales bacterium]|jgi:L-ascorbate metabolism protein UlaG (beta-lactamase superfamily)|nr:MBL fold metallo-hydrolase [Bacteroidales bacterium]HOI32450.1 MBL fold metallo-hydrolase [Bacteroidales bacterium]
MKKIINVLILFLLLPFLASTQEIFDTSVGELKITIVGHASLMLEFQDKIIHIDPWSQLGDYGQLPDADLILLTHEHRDHLDQSALDKITSSNTKMIYTRVCDSILTYSGAKEILINGDRTSFESIDIEAVPAYNLVHKRDDGQLFHPKGRGNGYVLTFGDTRLYIAADTEDIPEMKQLGQIDIAFIPMNIPYTMTPEMAANAAKMIQPKILYPYHYGDSDLNKLAELLKDEKNIEVRIR